MFALKPWLRNIRFYILTFSIVLAAGIFLWIQFTLPNGSEQIVKLTEDYALLALLFLYLSLLPTPLYLVFPSLPYKEQWVKARRALGVSAFLFASLHAYCAFFDQLGGFAGLSFLSNTYLIAISLSATALLILCLMTLTSFDYMVRKLGKNWKRLHQWVYVAGILVLIHALLLGTNFSDPANSPIAQITFAAVAFLFILEAIRIDRGLANRFSTLPQVGMITIIMVAFLTLLPHYLEPSTGGTSINIHAGHIQLAKEAQQTTSPFAGNPNINLNSPAFAGLRGDSTKRYTVSFSHDQNPVANQNVQLNFQVFDASSGYPVSIYSKVYSKLMHLVIVDEQLNYFNHIHPDLANNQFSITTQFPHNGLYHLYIDYQPFGAIEQQQAFSLQVGTGGSAEPTAQPETNLTKTFGQFQVSMTTSAPLKASELSIGNQTISFTLKNSTGQPVTNLQPYLDAFGHLVMINEQTFDYLHVHPNNLTIPPPGSNGGPTVQFLPLGLYGPIKSGTYRVFAEFNPGGTLLLTNFTISVQ